MTSVDGKFPLALPSAHPFEIDELGRTVGLIKLYDSVRGFGFITNNPELIDSNVTDSFDVFFHIHEFKRGITLSLGDRVQFRLIYTARGFKAVDCIVLKPVVAQSRD